MDYKRIYDQLIERAKTRLPLTDYKERHHIVMRSLGGTDDPDNLVDLTAREHFIAHWLLYRINPNIKTASAFFMMANMDGRCTKRNINAHQYEMARRAFSKAQKQRVISPETRAKLSAANMGRKLTPEHRARCVAYLQNRVQSPEERAKRAASLRGRERVITDEWRENMKKAAKTRKPASAETRRKISEAGRKRRATDETKAKMSKSQKGRVVSAEHRAKISATLTGRKCGPRSEVTRRKISERKRYRDMVRRVARTYISNC